MRQKLIVDSSIDIDLVDVPANAIGDFTIKGSEDFEGIFSMIIYKDGEKVYEADLPVNKNEIKVSINATGWKLKGKYFEYKIIGTKDGKVKNYMKGKMELVW